MTVRFTSLLHFAVVSSGQQALVDRQYDTRKLVNAATRDAFELSMDDIWAIFKPEIENFGRYFPVEKRFNINVNATGDGISYDFTRDPRNQGYEDASNPGEPPFYVSKAIPVNMYGALGGVYGASLAGIFYKLLDSNYGEPNRLVQMTIAPTRYAQPPILILPNAGRWDVTCHYDYMYDEYESDGNLVDVEIHGLNNGLSDDSQLRYFKILKDILAAVFKRQVGLSRRAFTNTRLQIQNDSDKMVNEANEEYKAAIKRLQAVNPTWRIG